MVFYDYIIMLGLSLAYTITTLILTSTNLACYKCVNCLPLLINNSFIIVCWKVMKMDVGIFMLL